MFKPVDPSGGGARGEGGGVATSEGARLQESKWDVTEIIPLVKITECIKVYSFRPFNT